jgi:5-methyltetrahydrofolate--homocysteine methyltransferase
MSLFYKEDWEETKQRYRAWWAGEAIGRCCLAVTAPRKNPFPVFEPGPPTTAEQRWTDLDYISALCEYTHAHTFYGGEAFPVWHGGYAGFTRLAVILGCPISLDFSTGWVDPILTGEDIEYESLRLKDNEPHFQFALRLLRRGCEEAKGKSIPSIGAFGGCGDTLAALRGTERLLYDVMDRPERVRAADGYLMDLWCRLYDEFYSIIRDTAEGSTCWFELWSAGKFYSCQNDFSYMISPRMFEEIFLPTIEKQTEFLDHAVFHVDGVGAFVHVDTLCRLPRLQAIQILPGAGKPSPLAYMPVLKKVQAAGKNLHITIPAHEVEAVLAELSARGLFIATGCETEDEARALLRKAETWSRDRKVCVHA